MFISSRFHRSILPVLTLGALLAGSVISTAENAVVPATAEGQAIAAPATSEQTRIVIVEWKIRKGHEQEFLDYWAKKSVVADRSGLVAEFMSRVEDRDKFPWINWVAVDTSADYTPFYNVGIWKNSDEFVGQIGKYIDLNRPPLPFEADRRHRVFLAPAEWRIGQSSLPAKDAEGVR